MYMQFSILNTLHVSRASCAPTMARIVRWCFSYRMTCQCDALAHLTFLQGNQWIYKGATQSNMVNNFQTDLSLWMSLNLLESSSAHKFALTSFCLFETSSGCDLWSWWGWMEMNRDMCKHMCKAPNTWQVLSCCCATPKNQHFKVWQVQPFSVNIKFKNLWMSIMWCRSSS